MNLTITNKPEETNFPATDVFKKAYASSTPNITGISLISNDSTNADTIGIVATRIFIEKSQKAISASQKYIISLRFSNFGDMCIVDLISLDKGFHRNIIAEHLRRMDWNIIPAEAIKNDADSVIMAPIVMSGGHLKIDDTTDETYFFGESMDFTGSIFRNTCNSMAAYLMTTCNLPVSKENDSDIEAGREFFEKLVTFMANNKLKDNFYELAVDFIREQNSKDSIDFTSQHIGGLISMAAVDKCHKNGTEFMQTHVLEMVEGVGRYIFVSGFAKTIKRNRKESASEG